MIHYKQDAWVGLRILCLIHGSVVPQALPRAIISGCLCFACMYWHLVDYDVKGGGSIMWHPSCYVFFLQISAYTLAFHTNQAYNRYWEARTQVQQMASYWGDAISQYVAFDEVSKLTSELNHSAQQDGSRWRAQLIHLTSLLHAVCIQYLLNQDAAITQLEVLGGIDKHESDRLSMTDDQAYLVMHWISQQVSLRHCSGGLAVPAPILSRSWQVLSLGMLAYNQACKIEDTPFPFPYVQLLHLMDWLMIFVTPVVIASWMSSIVFAVVLTMMVVGAFHAMFSAACIMETPFGRRSNDLPLVELHRDFVCRLKSIVDIPVAEQLNKMILECDLEYTTQQDDPIQFLPPLSATRFSLGKASAQKENAMTPLLDLFSANRSKTSLTGRNNRTNSIKTAPIGGRNDASKWRIKKAPCWFDFLNFAFKRNGDKENQRDAKREPQRTTNDTHMLTAHNSVELVASGVNSIVHRRLQPVGVREHADTHMQDSNVFTDTTLDTKITSRPQPAPLLLTGDEGLPQSFDPIGENYNTATPVKLDVSTGSSRRSKKHPFSSSTPFDMTPSPPGVFGEETHIVVDEVPRMPSNFSDSSGMFLSYSKDLLELRNRRNIRGLHSEAEASANHLNNCHLVGDNDTVDATSDDSCTSGKVGFLPRHQLRHQDSFPLSDVCCMATDDKPDFPIRHTRSQETIGPNPRVVDRFPRQTNRLIASGVVHHPEHTVAPTIVSCDEQLPVTIFRRIGSRNDRRFPSRYVSSGKLRRDPPRVFSEIRVFSP